MSIAGKIYFMLYYYRKSLVLDPFIPKHSLFRPKNDNSTLRRFFSFIFSFPSCSSTLNFPHSTPLFYPPSPMYTNHFRISSLKLICSPNRPLLLKNQTHSQPKKTIEKQSKNNRKTTDSINSINSHSNFNPHLSQFCH